MRAESGAKIGLITKSLLDGDTTRLTATKSQELVHNGTDVAKIQEAIFGGGAKTRS